MAKIGIFIPTYQQSKLVKDVLDNELELYCELEFNLYILDSSIDDKTKELIFLYKKKFSNLFYLRFPSNIHPNMRVYHAFQMAKEGLVDCEYLWIRSDAMLCQEFFLRSLVSYLKYDLIVTTPQTENKKGICIVRDVQRFFVEYACQLCLFGGVILNVARMIATADWAYLSRKYLVRQHMNFSHVCFYFEQILKVKNCKILVFDLPERLYYNNPKKKMSSWKKDVFSIWMDYWPKSINNLPAYYKDKLQAIRRLGLCGKDDGIYRFTFLEQLVKEEVLTLKVFDKYRERICRYSGVGENRFKAALHLIPMRDADLYRTEEYKQLLAFVRQFPSLVIYGCGKWALRYVRYFQEQGVIFDKFIVTDDRNIPSVYLEHDVIIRDAYEFKETTGIVLAMRPEYQMDVWPFFCERNMENNVFTWPRNLAAYYVSFVEALKNHKITGMI